MITSTRTARSGFRAAVAALGVAALALSMAACTSTPSGNKSGDTAITVALTQAPISLDPCDTRETSNSLILSNNVLEALTKVDSSDGEIKPLLATSWKQKSPTEWTFTLRKGVKFHDGSDFDAAAAAASISRIFDPDLECVVLGIFSDETITATATDANTLSLVTSKPDPILPTRLTYVDIASAATPADAKTQDPIGTGPYAFGKYVQDQSLEVTRFADYWGDKPAVTAATYVFRDSSAVRASMVSTGEADIALGISEQNATSDDRTKAYDENQTVSLRPNNSAPLNNIDVRSAIALAIDRKTISSALLPKTSKPTNQLVSKLINGYIPDYKGPGFDLDKAKDLIKKARAEGAPVDAEIQLVASANEYPGSDDVVTALANQLQAAGLNVTVQLVEHSAWLDVLHKPFPADAPPQLLNVAHDNATGDASFSLVTYLQTGGNSSPVSDPKIDDLLNQALGATGDDRADLFQKVAERGYEQGDLIPYISLYGLLGLSNRVDYTPNGLSTVSLELATVSFR